VRLDRWSRIEPVQGSEDNEVKNQCSIRVEFVLVTKFLSHECQLIKLVKEPERISR
jgi:hypothetical protein